MLAPSGEKGADQTSPAMHDEADTAACDQETRLMCKGGGTQEQKHVLMTRAANQGLCVTVVQAFVASSSLTSVKAASWELPLAFCVFDSL